MITIRKTPCPDTTIEVNGTTEGTVGAGSTVDIQLSDSGGVVTPTSVTQVGTDFQVVLPDAAAPTPISTATLMRTGQTTVYRTDDDADTSSEGRDTDFFTLAENNPFGNTDRFTDELGGQTYINNWGVDWSTYNGSSVLGYYLLPQGLATWDNGIDNASGVFGGFSGGRMWNRFEALNILNHEVAVSRLNYSPFNYTTNANFMTSTTQPLLTTSVYGYQNLSGIGLSRAKTATSVYLVVRTFTVTGTILT